MVQFLSVNYSKLVCLLTCICISLHYLFRWPCNWSPTEVSSIKVYVCVVKEMKYIFKFSTNRGSNSNKWLDAVWLHCRETPILVGHCCPSPQYHSRSTQDATPPTWPFDTLGTRKQAGKMAPWWGGLQACFRFHQSYNKTRFLYSSRTHHLEVSHFYYSCCCLCHHRPSKQNHHTNHADSFLFYKCSIGLLGKLRADDSKLEATAGLFDQVINSIFIVKFIWNSYCTVVIDGSEEWLSQ